MLHFLRSRLVLLVFVILIISSMAGIVYFWNAIDRHLNITQSRWVSEMIAFWDEHGGFWGVVKNSKVLAISTVVGGIVAIFSIFGAIIYLLKKILPFLKGVFEKMTDPLVKQTPPPELPEGQVPLDSPFYMERPPVESDCYEAISRPYALIRIKAPRQMGKSSLMTRVLHYAEKQGCRPVPVYFQQADSAVFANLTHFLQWFCASVTFSLNLEDRIEDHWKGILGSKDKAGNYFQKYLLTEIPEPLALALDEADLIFEYPKIAADFFALLRAWHERGKNDAVWKKFRLIIVHSQEVYIPLNINQSPFNVGLPVELPELNKNQAEELAKRHGLNFPAKSFEELSKMVGGHPYLLRAAMYHLARKRLSLKKFLRRAPTEQGIYADHLRRHLSNLREDDRLADAMKQVITADKPVKIGETETFKLRSLGLVRFEGDGNDVVPLCDLYRRYFRERL